MRHGRRVRSARLMICRQLPGTASGVTLMTMEDDEGFVNVVLWTRVFQAHRILAVLAPFAVDQATIR